MTVRSLSGRCMMLTKRCGGCDNCKKLEKVKRSVLRAVNPPFSHADDGVVAVWNDMLASLPCLRYRYGHNEVFTRAMDAGSYDNAYSSEDLALCNIEGKSDEYRAGYVLGFFSSYEVDEVPGDWQDEVETLRSAHDNEVDDDK